MADRAPRRVCPSKGDRRLLDRPIHLPNVRKTSKHPHRQTHTSNGNTDSRAKEDNGNIRIRARNSECTRKGEALGNNKNNKDKCSHSEEQVRSDCILPEKSGKEKDGLLLNQIGVDSTPRSDKLCPLSGAKLRHSDGCSSDSRNCRLRSNRHYNNVYVDFNTGSNSYNSKEEKDSVSKPKNNNSTASNSDSKTNNIENITITERKGRKNIIQKQVEKGKSFSNVRIDKNSNSIKDGDRGNGIKFSKSASTDMKTHNKIYNGKNSLRNSRKSSAGRRAVELRLAQSWQNATKIQQLEPYNSSAAASDSRGVHWKEEQRNARAKTSGSIRHRGSFSKRVTNSTASYSDDEGRTVWGSEAGRSAGEDSILRHKKIGSRISSMLRSNAPMYDFELVPLVLQSKQRYLDPQMSASLNSPKRARSAVGHIMRTSITGLGDSFNRGFLTDDSSAGAGFYNDPHLPDAKKQRQWRHHSFMSAHNLHHHGLAFPSSVELSSSSTRSGSHGQGGRHMETTASRMSFRRAGGASGHQLNAHSNPSMFRYSDWSLPPGNSQERDAEVFREKSGIKVKITPGLRDDGMGLTTSHRLDDLTFQIVKLHKHHRRGSRAAVRRMQQPLAETSHLAPVDVMAQAKSPFAEDCHNAFSTCRIPTLRRSPALIVEATMQDVTTSRKGSDSLLRREPLQMSESSQRASGKLGLPSIRRNFPLKAEPLPISLRIDRFGVGSPKFFPWAPFNPCAVKLARCLVLMRAHVCPAHQEPLTPNINVAKLQDDTGKEEDASNATNKKLLDFQSGVKAMFRNSILGKLDCPKYWGIR